MKCSGSELHQHVEADVALDAEAVGRRRTACARAPNCTVLEVIAKYASQVSRGLFPELSAMATRSSAGTPAGGAKRGLKPPTASTKLEPGPELQRARSAIAPVSGNLCTRRESTSTASIDAVPWSKSITPIASRFSRTRSLSGDGSSALMRPSTSSRVRAPNSRISARSSSTSVGVNQPMRASSPSR